LPCQEQRARAVPQLRRPVRLLVFSYTSLYTRILTEFNGRATAVAEPQEAQSAQESGPFLEPIVLLVVPASWDCQRDELARILTA
jgi:hypothetical protein